MWQSGVRICKRGAVASNETAEKRYPIVVAEHLVEDDNQKLTENTSCRIEIYVIYGD
jgi:hypothetical protein